MSRGFKFVAHFKDVPWLDTWIRDDEECEKKETLEKDEVLKELAIYDAKHEEGKRKLLDRLKLITLRHEARVENAVKRLHYEGYLGEGVDLDKTDVTLDKDVAQIFIEKKSEIALWFKRLAEFGCNQKNPEKEGPCDAKT